MFKKIGLIAKHGDLKVKASLEVLVNCLYQHHFEYMLDKTSAQLLSRTDFVASMDVLGQQCDLIIVIGGDGTLLQAARVLAKYDISLLGINLGRLGFLTDISPTEIETYLVDILNGDFREENRFLIEATVHRDKQCISHCNALNDIVIYRGNVPHVLFFETKVNGHFVNCQHADGLVIATPTGSTAYALSAGGPIIHPTLNVLVLVTICPHTFSSRPIIIDGDSEITITINSEQRGNAQLDGDSVLCHTLKPGDSVVIKKHQHIRLIHPMDHDHYATLRTKLDWS
ncbi:MAG: NAD(+) kinase [Thiomargarita sp.]|nr:NAD(+) kinase [Thiomargarita sp.]